MIAKTVLKKLLFIFGVCLLCASVFTNAFADGRYGEGYGRRWQRSLPPRHEVIVVGRNRYHYYDGRFYRPAWFGFGFTVIAPPFGTAVRVLPFGYRTITVRGTPYYYYNNVYYTTYPSGYIVVPRPAIEETVVVQPQPSTRETVTINIPNSRGGYTPITLLKQSNGYVGPQGEYYPTFPTVEQLRLLYGN